MAAPWVSGTVALMMAAAGRPLTIHEIRRALIGTADPHPGPSGRTSTQLGYGYLNTAAAVAAARRLGLGDEGAPPRAVPPIEDRESEETGWAPVWVEEAAAGADVDERVDDEQAVGVEEGYGCAREAAGEDCGCGRRGEVTRTGTPAEGESGDEGSDDEDESIVPFEAPDEQIKTPFAWEDVREALDAVEENDA